MKRTALNRFNPATGPKWMNRGGPLNKVSKSQAKVKQQQAACYAEVKAASSGRCEGCGGTWFLTPSHILSQKQFSQHRNNPLNVLILCVNCHSCYEHNKRKFSQECPAAWALTLERMQAVDTNAYAVFLLNHEWARPGASSATAGGGLGREER